MNKLIKYLVTVPEFQKLSAGQVIWRYIWLLEVPLAHMVDVSHKPYLISTNWKGVRDES